MSKTVFVVDDSTANLALAEEALGEDYNVLTFASAEKMLPALEKVTPDLILLDIEMPGMNGFEAMQLLKSTDAHSKIPVVFLTAMNDAANEDYGLELGAAGFISKPFSVPDFLAKIKSLIG
jgi:putative two-component system response regulator